ncbi:MAG: hypothetical protein H6Q70_2125 [Firmicutes bacterium]|nr:hypothetical protein [Bacillota bacterium]
MAFDGTADITVPTMPIGSIIMWAFSTLPGGDDEGKWLECNGQSTDGYPELAAIAGAIVPDFRGYFLRGFGGNSAELGVKQGDAIRNIKGVAVAPQDITTPTLNLQEDSALYTSGINTGVNFIDSSTTSSFQLSQLHIDASRAVPTANENRPINKAVIYLIKAKQ